MLAMGKYYNYKYLRILIHPTNIVIMRLLLILLTLLISALCHAKSIVTICDSTDKTPIIGASVISANGMILGATDQFGSISVEGNDFPLSVRCLGFGAATADNGCDSIFLHPSVYMLSEVSVSPADRPITRVVTYVREYCTGSTKTDSMQMFSEYMLEYFFADGKVKGYNKNDGTLANKLAWRKYARIANSQGVDSLLRPGYYGGIADISFMDNMLFSPKNRI